MAPYRLCEYDFHYLSKANESLPTYFGKQTSIYTFSEYIELLEPINNRKNNQIGKSEEKFCELEFSLIHQIIVACMHALFQFSRKMQN